MNRAAARSFPVVAPDHAEIEFDLIEALFFGYRGFVAEPDRTLSARGFGRAHHRVLYFVYRNPGLTIAALLDILQITKQSLARVLKDLVDGGLIEQKEGADDRRQRLLFATEEGKALAFALANGQSERLRMALIAAGPRGREAVEQFLNALAEPWPVKPA
ncbi:MAG: MarR family winged helix-turn-helix transcriptional regulator [Beijerinckiaceae bacterium]|nr:MarR family winged helix-turn-helix transcriptional regulator [Beijerinckiaceae bacterium]